MNEDQIKVLQALVDQTKAQLDAYTAVLTLAQNGYQSDQEVTQQAIYNGIQAVVTPLQDVLTSANSTLTSLTNAKTSIVADPATTVTPADPVVSTDTPAN